jgi:phytoene dehydrogenase-like protein
MQTARDVLNDRFRSPVAKALIAPWVPHLNRTLDSVSSGFDVSLLLSALMAGGMPLPRGGGDMLVKALGQIVTDHGGAIRCGAPVDRILVERGRAVGVRIRGCLKSPGRSRLTVRGPGFAPAVWKLEWGNIVGEI